MVLTPAFFWYDIIGHMEHLMLSFAFSRPEGGVLTLSGKEEPDWYKLMCLTYRHLSGRSHVPSHLELPMPFGEGRY